MDMNKSLDVHKYNNFVNVIAIYRMCQEKDKCLKVDWGKNGLFMECHMMLQLVHGLHNFDIQQKVLEEGAYVDSGELSLKKFMKLYEAWEIGKSKLALVIQDK